MRIISEGASTVTFDHGEVHSLSVDMLKLLSENDVNVMDGSLACALSLGRLMSPTKLAEDDELTFLSSIMEWTGAYFAVGGAN